MHAMQGSSEVFFRRVKFWDKEHSDAPPVFIVEGVSYLHIKVCMLLPALHQQLSHWTPPLATVLPSMWSVLRRW